MERVPRAQRGHSRDQRGDCKQVVLAEMRASDPPVSYWVGTPRAQWQQFEKELAEKPWEKLRDSIQVKLFSHEGEVYGLVRSEGRQAKEVAMRRRRLAKLLRTLRALRRERKNPWKRDTLLLKLGAARQGCGGDIMVSPRGTVELAQEYGELLAAAVEQTVRSATRPVQGSLRCAFETVPVAFAPPPSRAELEARARGKDTESARQAREFLRASADELQRHAQELLKILDRDGHLLSGYPYPLQVWQFGADLTLIAMAGEPVVAYALRLKKELGADKLWVTGYCNDVFTQIPSVRVLEEGGYEGGGAIIGARLPGPFAPSVEETIVQKVHELVERVRTEQATQMIKFGAYETIRELARKKAVSGKR